MFAEDRRVPSRRTKSLAQLQRDAALARVGRLRRWTVLGAGALTAGFAALVSAIAPGHSLAARHVTREGLPGSGGRATARRGAAHRSAQLPPLASPRQLGLQGPTSHPKPDPGSGAAQQSQPSPAPAPSPPAPTQQAAPAPAPAQSGAVSGGS